MTLTNHFYSRPHYNEKAKDNVTEPVARFDVVEALGKREEDV